MEHASEQRNTQSVFAIPALHLHVMLAVLHEPRIPVDPQCMEVQRNSK